jgi:hypothetical protein
VGEGHGGERLKAKREADNSTFRRTLPALMFESWMHHLSKN